MTTNPIGMRDDIWAQWDGIEDPWARMWAIATQLVRENPDATVYDLFNFIREEIFKGGKYEEDSEFIKQTDWAINHQVYKRKD